MKLTPEQKIIEAAKLDDPQHKWEHILDPDGKTWVVGFRYPAGRCYIRAKNFPDSYDAIIPLIQKQSPEIRAEMFEKTNGRVTIMTTPSQLLDALLAAHGFEV